MIHKVSNHSKGPEWMNEDSSSQRESISKSAAGSFSEILVKRAKVLKAKGQSYAEIAKAFAITENVLKGMIEASHNAESARPTCDCMEKSASTEDTSHTDGAQAAYESLHGKAPVAPELKDLEARRRVVAGNTSDNGGYHRSMGTVSKPTIFDPDVLDRMAATMDNGERIRKENADIEARRATAQKQYQTIDREELKTTIQEKAASVSSASGSDAHKYSKKLPMNGMSIFDEKDFERVSSTSGEKMTEAHKKEASEKQADRSWTENGRKTINTKDITKSMIDSMLDAKE